MTSPLSGPGYGFVWDNLNNGNVAPGAPITVSGSLTSASATITALGSAVSVTKGQYVTGTGVVPPSFISATTASATSITLNNNGTITAAETLTVQNFPALIGGEWSSTLAVGSALGSSYWNGNGVTRPADTNQAIFADVEFIAGGAFTPVSGGSVCGWFLRSYDGGNTFESAIATPGTAVAAVSRPPDFIISLDNATYAAGNARVQPQVPLPSVPFKTIVQNNTGTVIPSGSAVLCIPISPAQ